MNIKHVVKGDVSTAVKTAREYDFQATFIAVGNIC